jgi:hypothetical protein
LVLLQPDSISDGPGRGGKYCSNGVDLRTKRKYTEDEAKQRKKEKAKASYEKKKGTETEIGKIPMVVRTAWEQAGKPEGNLKAYMLKLFWEDINSSPADARAAASLAESEAAVKNPVVEARKGSVRCNGNAHSLPRFHTACNRIRARCGAVAALVRERVVTTEWSEASSGQWAAVSGTQHVTSQHGPSMCSTRVLVDGDCSIFANIRL